MTNHSSGNDSGDVDRTRDLARQYDREFVGLSGFRVHGSLLKKVPLELMLRYTFVPLEEMQDGKLVIAIADPSQILMTDELELLLRRQIVTKVSTLKQISDMLARIEQP